MEAQGDEGEEGEQTGEKQGAEEEADEYVGVQKGGVGRSGGRPTAVGCICQQVYSSWASFSS